MATVTTSAISVGALCDRFLETKRTLISIGELSPRTIEHYERATKIMRADFGEDTIVDTLRPDDFMRLRASISANRGPHSFGNHLQRVRTIFKYAYDTELIDQPMRFGQGMKKPDQKLYRRVRRERGPMMFDAAELRAMIEVAQPRVKPMILLGLNCGLGNTDCGRLTFANIDLDNAMLDYPRPKTETDRRAPLWPETVKAMQRAIVLRNNPLLPELSQTIFLTGRGNHWAHGNPSSSLTHEFKKIIARAGVERRKRGFYCLRRTFRTIADEVGDQPAAMLIMGHTAASNDMSAIYRQRISDDRLRVVTEYVRLWLWPNEELNHYENYRRRAVQIAGEWEQLEALSPDDVLRAMTYLGMTQTELSRFIGLNMQWLNCLVRGRKELSSDTELRLRAFIQQLSAGQHPVPLRKEELRVQFEKASDVPLPDEVKAALSVHPMKAANFRVLIDYLKEIGVKQQTLAGWWGYKWKFVRELAWGRYHAVPPRGADRLRELFGLPAMVPTYESQRPRRRLANPGTVTATPEIYEWLRSGEMTGEQFCKTTDYLKRECFVPIHIIASWMGLQWGTVYQIRYTKKVTPEVVHRLAQVFASEGGAE